MELAQVPFFPQQDFQCGPAALATVLQTTGVNASADELAPSVFLPGRKGSLQVELLAATRLRDRIPYQVPGELAALLEQVAAGRPVLVMQNLGLRVAPAWHFAVLVGYDLNERTLVLRSGTKQRLVMGADKFMRTWDRAQRWAFVALEPDRAPASPEHDRYIAAVAGLEAVGRLEAAERAYALALEHWPDSIWPRLGLANIAYTQQDLRSAEEGYRDVLAREPDNIIAHNNIAEILAKRGCIAEARSHIQRAITLALGAPLETAVTATARQIEASASAPNEPAQSCGPT